MNIKEKIDNRQYTNIQILKMLEDYFLAYPDIRFGQGLVNMNIIRYNNFTSDAEGVFTNNVLDPFNEESADILGRMKLMHPELVNKEGNHNIK